MKPKEQNIMKNKKGGVGVPSSVASWRVGPWESTKVMPSWTDTKTVGVCEKGGEAAVFVPLSTQGTSTVIGDPGGRAILTEKDEPMIEEKTLGHITEDDIWG